MWFSQKVLVFDLSKDTPGLIKNTAESAKRSKHILSKLNDFIRQADLGIEAIEIVERSYKVEHSPKRKNVLSVMDSSPLHDMNTLMIKSVYKTNDPNLNIELDLEESESTGTQRLFALAGPLFAALEMGYVLIVDEIECSMHSLLTRKLIELFQSSKINKKRAQLIFATHDSTLLDQELFRRDQIWFIEKNKNAASELYSLVDIKEDNRPRSTTAFQRNYLAGRYGAVPNFGPILDDPED
jgi:AAA15 family ATPase/GTPase